MTDDTISPLRRRMIEDMTVRGFTACTQRGYIAAVRRFTVFLARSPDQATAEDLRRFQLQMRVEGASSTTMNAAVSALRFFFGVTLGRGDAEVGLTTVREPRRLPVVLSPEEVTRLLDLVELDPKYVDVSVQRWQSFAGAEATLDETGETFAEVVTRRNAPTPASPSTLRAEVQL